MLASQIEALTIERPVEAAPSSMFTSSFIGEEPQSLLQVTSENEQDTDKPAEKPAVKRPQKEEEDDSDNESSSSTSSTSEEEQPEEPKPKKPRQKVIVINKPPEIIQQPPLPLPYYNNGYYSGGRPVMTHTTHHHHGHPHHGPHHTMIVHRPVSDGYGAGRCPYCGRGGCGCSGGGCGMPIVGRYAMGVCARPAFHHHHGHHHGHHHPHFVAPPRFAARGYYPAAGPQQAQQVDHTTHTTSDGSHATHTSYKAHPRNGQVVHQHGHYQGIPFANAAYNW